MISIESTTELKIDSTAGLSGAAIADEPFTVSQCPKFTVLDSHYNQTHSDYDSFVYGVDKDGVSTGTQYETGVGWVGVTTYTDAQGELRVKKEILVSMSGITTGNAPTYPPS